MADEVFRHELDAFLAQFGRRVRSLREATGLSQEEFAKQIDVHRTEISSIERGKREPRLSVLLILASGLDVEVGELLKGLHAPRTRRIQPTRRGSRG